MKLTLSQNNNNIKKKVVKPIKINDFYLSILSSSNYDTLKAENDDNKNIEDIEDVDSEDELFTDGEEDDGEEDDVDDDNYQSTLQTPEKEKTTYLTAQSTPQTPETPNESIIEHKGTPQQKINTPNDFINTVDELTATPQQTSEQQDEELPDTTQTDIVNENSLLFEVDDKNISYNDLSKLEENTSSFLEFLEEQKDNIKLKETEDLKNKLENMNQSLDNLKKENKKLKNSINEDKKLYELTDEYKKTLKNNYEEVQKNIDSLKNIKELEKQKNIWRDKRGKEMLEQLNKKSRKKKFLNQQSDEIIRSAAKIQNIENYENDNIDNLKEEIIKIKKNEEKKKKKEEKKRKKKEEKEKEKEEKYKSILSILQEKKLNELKEQAKDYDIKPSNKNKDKLINEIIEKMKEKDENN